MSLSSYVSRQFAHPNGLGGRLVTAVGARQNRGLYEAAIRLLAVGDTDRVLDVGCGNGTLGSLSHTGTGYVFHDPADLVAASRRAGFRVETTPALSDAAYCLVYQAV